MSGGEVPVWVAGCKKWVSGLNKKTTCEEVVKALLQAEKQLDDDDVSSYVMVERWRKVERPLEPKTKLLKAWSAWGEEQANVRLTLKRSGGGAHRQRRSATHSRRKTYTKAKWRQLATVHPKKLMQQQEEESEGAKLGGEGMERLMQVIIAQGQTIQQQLRCLNAKEEQIESFEHRLHQRRVQSLGANYLLDTYLLEQQQEAKEEEVKLQHCIVYYERLLRIGQRLEEEEQRCQRLSQQLLAEGAATQVTEEELEEARRRVQGMEAINRTNLRQLEANEMQLAKFSVWLEDKRCFLRHLEADLGQAEEENQRLLITPPAVSSFKETDTDSNSDTGLSSLHSSSDDVILDTLV